MKTLRRILVSSVSFLGILVFLILLILEPYMMADTGEWDDYAIRRQLDGKINVVFCGACHCNYGIDTRVIDEKLGCCSYNLSGPELTWRQREYLLKDVIENNPVETVFFEIAYDNLVRDNENKREALIRFLPRVDKLGNRLKFFFEDTPLSLYPILVSDMMQSSLSYHMNLFLHKDSSQKKEIFDQKMELKGFIPYEPIDMTYSVEEVSIQRDSIMVDTKLNQETLDILDRVMNYCKDRNIKVYFIVTPISVNKLWQVDNFDVFNSNLKDLGKKYDCPVYDFNLQKNYSSLYNPQDSFHDEFHLSASGATVFCDKLCDLLLMSEENRSDMFFPSYKEAKKYNFYANEFPACS